MRTCCSCSNASPFFMSARGEYGWSLSAMSVSSTACVKLPSLDQAAARCSSSDTCAKGSSCHHTGHAVRRGLLSYLVT